MKICNMPAILAAPYIVLVAVLLPVFQRSDILRLVESARFRVFDDLFAQIGQFEDVSFGLADGQRPYVVADDTPECRFFAVEHFPGPSRSLEMIDRGDESFV